MKVRTDTGEASSTADKLAYSQLVQPHETTSSTLLDLMRGLAAIVVLVSHWKDLLFVPYSEAINKSVSAKLFYAVTGGGHQAVIIFFVLSGYLITSSIDRSHKSNRWSWWIYLEHRLARLWTVLLPALVLITILDTFGIHTARASALYFGDHYSNMMHSAAANLTWQTALSNAFFFQGILTDTYGSDGPLWSLSYEFWYYILFPLALAVMLRRSSWKTRILSLVLALLVGKMVGFAILSAFPVWLMGAALNYIPKPRRHPRITLCLTLLYLPLTFSRSAGHPMVFQYLLGLATTVLIWMILGLDMKAPDAWWAHGSRLLAKFSYTLYVVHAPILVLIIGSWIGLNLQQATGGMILKASPLLGLALVAAYGIAWLTEFRTDFVRRWLTSLRLRLLPRDRDLKPSAFATSILPIVAGYLFRKREAGS